MDMKPLFRESHSPTRYPFVWQSRAAKFYRNIGSANPSSVMNNQQQQQTHQSHTNHHHHHHHNHNGIANSSRSAYPPSTGQPRQVQHGQYSKSAKVPTSSTTGGLFSHSFYGDGSKAHSRRQFFPSPPAVAPKPQTVPTPATMTATITTSSANHNQHHHNHHQSHHHHSGHHSVHHSQSQTSAVPFGAAGDPAELSCTSSSTPTGGETSSNYDHDDSAPFVRIGEASNRLNSKMPRNSYPDSHHHHSSRYHQSQHHRQTSPSHHHYSPNRCPIGLCQKLPPAPAPTSGPTQFDPSRYPGSGESFEYPLLQQYHHPFSFYSTPELHSAGRSPYYLNSSPQLAHHRHHHHQSHLSHPHLPPPHLHPHPPTHHHHAHPHHHPQFQYQPPPPYFVPYSSRSHLHLPSNSTSGLLGKKTFDNPYAAMRFYNESAAKYRSSLLNRNHHRLHGRRKCRGHLIVLSIILAVITVGVIMGVILAMTIN